MIDVLIVEDDPMVAMLNKEFCERMEGLKVIGHAESTADAWSIIDQQEPDLILLDIYLPGQTGLEFAESLKKKGIFIPILFISAADDIESVQQAVYFGATDYLIKPFTFERFQASLKKIIKFDQALSKGKVTNQKTLDQYFCNEQIIQTEMDSNKLSNRSSIEFPKGISKITMKKVVKQILITKEWFTTENIATEIGISRISTKKYIQYLVDLQILDEEMDYNTVGRPAIIYQINENSAVEIEQFVYK